MQIYVLDQTSKKKTEPENNFSLFVLLWVLVSNTDLSVQLDF